MGGLQLKGVDCARLFAQIYDSQIAAQHLAAKGIINITMYRLVCSEVKHPIARIRIDGQL